MKCVICFEDNKLCLDGFNSSIVKYNNKVVSINLRDPIATSPHQTYARNSTMKGKKLLLLLWLWLSDLAFVSYASVNFRFDGEIQLVIFCFPPTARYSQSLAKSEHLWPPFLLFDMPVPFVYCVYISILIIVLVWICVQSNVMATQCAFFRDHQIISLAIRNIEWCDGEQWPFSHSIRRRNITN